MIWESMRIAIRAVKAAKLRSFLTMLGVIIGVASVVAVVAVGAGAQAQIAEHIRSLGSNVLMIYSTAAIATNDSEGPRRFLEAEDAKTIVEQIPSVQAAAPYDWTNAQIVRGNRNVTTVLWGTTSDYFVIRDWPLVIGRHFLPEEEASAGKRILLGAGIAQRLFGDENPAGAEVRVENIPVQVVGVLAPRGAMGSARSLDDDIFAPISTVNRRIKGSIDEVRRDAVGYIVVKSRSASSLEQVKVDLQELLRQRRGHDDSSKQDFHVVDPAAQIAVQQGTAKTFAILLAAVASISLVVGGISIMNIMLVSVSERTREIGLRIALGARCRDVRNQFLLEAVALCVAGGVIGIAVGVLATFAVARVAGWPVLVGADTVVAAVASSILTGLFFGWYPARKAARLQPVEALRSE
jgi:putative ABC transport system permease protein